MPVKALQLHVPILPRKILYMPLLLRSRMVLKRCRTPFLNFNAHLLLINVANYSLLPQFQMPTPFSYLPLSSTH